VYWLVLFQKFIRRANKVLRNRREMGIVWSRITNEILKDVFETNLEEGLEVLKSNRK
jgi:hypothetical protein